MKKIILILVCWPLFVNTSETTEWYVEVPNPDKGVTVKVGRDFYNEYMEIVGGNTKINTLGNIIKKEEAIKKHKKAVEEYEQWENVEKHIYTGPKLLYPTVGF